MLRDLFSLFPAHAGVILEQLGQAIQILAFPRTCGGDPEQYSLSKSRKGLFPAHAGVIPCACLLRRA